MATTAAAQSREQDPRGSNLDVDWLLHSKREFNSPQSKDNTGSQKQETQSAPTPSVQQASSPAQTQPPSDRPSTPTETPKSEPRKPIPTYTPFRDSVAASQFSGPGPQAQAARATTEEPKKATEGQKKDRRKSWFSSLGHKISGNTSHGSKNPGVDSTPPKQSVASPKLEFQNPFDKSSPQTAKPSQAAQSPLQPKSTKQAQQPKEEVVLTHHVPAGTRRPSVLVAAGTETKLDQPSFLTSALRRLSSGSAVTLGKGAGSTNAVAPRRIMNVDQNRQRSAIPEFDQNKLRRVAFCVDVEIAGVAALADEEGYGPSDAGDKPGATIAQKITDMPISKRASMSSKYKEKGEGAALKDPVTAEEDKEILGKPKEEIIAEKMEERHNALDALEGGASSEKPEGKPAPAAPSETTMTRKKEKKKRSEAERKERRERKRRHAEMNGLVPLELIRDDDDSDSSSEMTPGTNTPRNGDKPTTNPLRIYKRCCQLRETTALSAIKEQISKPTAILAESAGTVASINLSGTKMSLQDIVTFGDWLAVVPVRKLILDDCGLGDEAIRVILSGLLGCKTSEQARQNRKLPKHGHSKQGQEQLGVIERLSLKNNSAITNLGWKHIALFIHMSGSLCAIDLTGIPYPRSTGLTRTNTENNTSPATPTGTLKVPTGTPRTPTEIGSLVARAIQQRFGNKLEELIVSGCSLSATNVSEIIDAAIKCRIRRLGLAGNRLNSEAMGHVVRYAVSDVCEGLDLGSNDLHDNTHLLSEVVHESNPMFALSLADCNLTPDDLTRILPKLCEMKNFKFLDLSRNHGLFEGESTAVHILRKCLPKMKALKRLHLVDVGLKPDHIIAISDILPDCPALAHINILENVPLIQKMNSAQIDYQEEAAAFLASMMTATRVSRTLIAIELEVPGPDSSEVVKALSQQVVAYSLRNMETSALSDFGVESKAMPDRDAPDVLLHLVGHMDGYDEDHDKDEPAPDEDYLIASTGVVRALEVCLGNRDSRTVSRNMTPTESGAGTPRQGPLRPHRSRKRPKDVSRELCESAKKIRNRLQPALVKEDRAGNRDAYRRLWFLDQTLQGIIQRFEDTYPPSRPGTPDAPPELDISSPPDSPDLSRMSTVQDNNPEPVRDSLAPPDFDGAIKLSPSSSSTSLASKALSNEEGRMLRFGQSMKRDLLKPVGQDDFAHGTSVGDAPEPAHLVALRSKLTGMSGEEIRHKVETQGADSVVKELEINAEELRLMAIEDPVGFEALRNCSLMNEVRRMSMQIPPPQLQSTRRPRIPGTFNEEVTI